MLQRAGLAHGDLMAAIHAAAFAAADAWGGDAFRILLAQPGVQGLLHPDGGLILMRVAADEAEILTLAVMPDARRRGVGRLLLSGAVAVAESARAGTLFLEVSALNGPARTLYGQAGFAEVGRRRGYYADGSDALILRRRLATTG